MRELKFAEVVERAGVDAQTAQYALKHPAHLPGMPEAGSQGCHRTFTLRQAMQLAICTLLMKAGVPLRDAGALVRHCEEQAARSARGQKGLVYEAKQDQFWHLDILDARYAICWQGPRVGPHELLAGILEQKPLKGRTFVDLQTNGTCTHVPTPVMHHRIHLTEVESRIAGQG